MLAAAGWMCMAAARALRLPVDHRWMLLAIGFVTTGSILGYALRTGQPAVVAEFGIAMMMFGIARDRASLLVVGLSLAMLKPQLGLPFAVALCVQPRGMRPAILAAAVVMLASIPAFLASGVEDQVHGLLAATRRDYQAISYNSAAMMSGLPHLVLLLTSYSMSIGTSVLIACVLCGLMSWYSRRHRDDDRKIAVICLTCCITAAIIGLHTYDLVILLFVLPFMGWMPPGQRAIALAGMALLWRPLDLVRYVFGHEAYMPTVQTVGIGLILQAFVVTALLHARRVPDAPGQMRVRHGDRAGPFPSAVPGPRVQENMGS